MTPAIPTTRVNDRRRVDVSGNYRGPVASDSLFNHSATNQDGMRLRVTVPADRAHTTNAITKNDWEKDLSLSRQLYARVPEVNGALLQKSLYVIGDAWCPEYFGEDEGWGQAAMELLEPWMQVCDIRGEPFDFQTNLFITSLSMDRCGDQALLHVLDENREPRLQFKPSHCITSRYGEWRSDQNGFSIVPHGTYKGARAYNGIIFDRRGRVIAYNLLGETAKDDRQISTASCQLLYEPDWSDQGRGIPRLVCPLLNWLNYEDIQHFIQRQVKQDSAQGILHYNEAGSADSSRNWIQNRSAGTTASSTTTNSDVKIEQLEGNEVMYFRALGGGKIEPYTSSRPHANVDNYTMRIVRGCLQAAGWFYELYDPSAIGGANTRLIQDMARMSIWWRQRSVRKRAYRSVLWALSTWMDNGVLKRNDRDWQKWGFTTPAEITVDARYDDKTWMERIRMGAGTYEEYYGERGGNWKKNIRQRIKEQKFIQDECAKEKVDPNKVQILTPNGNTAEASGDEDEEPKKKSSKAAAAAPITMQSPPPTIVVNQPSKKQVTFVRDGNGAILSAQVTEE